MMMGDFNPRSPHGERPRCFSVGAAALSHFNPRSPHGERRLPAPLAALGRAISTHAPRTGSDAGDCRTISAATSFQPTLPARGATCLRSSGHRRSHISTHAPRTGSDRLALDILQRRAFISTHAPRTGSDGGCSRWCCPAGHFNPRSPHGERPSFRARSPS